MVTILIERRRAHPLAWIHRAEAHAIGAELRAAGKTVRFKPFDRGGTAVQESGILLLRVSDAVMLRAVDALSRAGIAYCGPGTQTLAHCYDKAHAYLVARANGVECPVTLTATQADALPRPLVLKPRFGSDSIGLRLVRDGPIPPACRNAGHLAQSFVRGAELTVGVLASEAGMPLRIALPGGSLYTFWRKYLRPPAKGAARGREACRTGAGRGAAHCADFRRRLGSARRLHLRARYQSAGLSRMRRRSARRSWHRHSPPALPPPA